MLICKLTLFFFLLVPPSVNAGEWGTHRQNIKDIETQIMQLEAELSDKVEKKKSTKDQARIEENLQRIVEIHSELISLRQSLNTELAHAKLEHPAQAGSSSMKESKKRIEDSKKKFSMNPLNLKLDDLIRKIQSKFSTFIQAVEETEELAEIEEVIKVKKLKRKDKDSEIYLRKKSKIKLVK